MYTLDACMVCGEPERTIVAEYNRLIFTDALWNSDLARFDYALCHGCGLVYATRRPERAEYEFLHDNFNEFLLRRENSKSFNVPQLTEERKEEIDRAFVPWWEVRSAPVKGFPIRKKLRHELDSALTYLPYIMLHVPLQGAKVLHVRAKGSTLADFMKRVLGAEQVDLITLFPSHTYMAEKNPGIRTTACLDYENFKIPFEEEYDLIIENHILVHMLDANRTFQVFASHLKKGGHIFLQAELADDVLFRKQKNLFAELRPFHYQHFDRRTLERILNRYGFEAVFLADTRSDKDPELFGVAKLMQEPRACSRIDAAELSARLDMYERWRDESILSLPKERCEALYGSEREQVWKRVRDRGSLKPASSGRAKGLRRFREAGVPDENLEIGSAFGEGPANLPARGRLAGIRAADWLAARLRGTRAAGWLAARAPRVARALRNARRAKSSAARTPGPADRGRGV